MRGSHRLWLLALTLSLTAESTRGQPVPWVHPDGTTHWYLAISDPAGITWEAARVGAADIGGHLATITSAAENAFVFQLVDDPSFWFNLPQGGVAGPWIGGFQPDGAPEPAGDWRWQTGELLTYTNWSPGQPDDVGGTENRIHFGDGSATRVASWDDLGADNPDIRGLVVEWTGSSPFRTVGSFGHSPGAADGYVILPTGVGATALLDLDGRIIHGWPGPAIRGAAAYLMDNGDLVRSFAIAGGSWNGISVGGLSGRVERRSWNGALTWWFEHVSSDYVAHHDIEILPNGNVLMLAWERKTMAQAIAAGRDPSLLAEGELWPEKVIEVAPNGAGGGTIVWEWHVWDHLVQDFDPAAANYGDPAMHPELIDVNYDTTAAVADWLHANSINYNPQLDQIVISVRHFNEIWVIDHSTTTAEAAGHTGGNSGRGGDLLYRWGNPAAHRAGTAADQTLFVQHDARWIPPGRPGQGNILIFNNGWGRPEGDYSSVDEIVPPVNWQGQYTQPPPGSGFLPAAPLWSYTSYFPGDFFSSIISGAKRLPNGNTFVTSGVRGDLFEITSTGEVVWSYRNPILPTGPITQGNLVPPCSQLASCNAVFRADWVPASHPGLAGRNLVPGELLEPYPPEIAARFGSVNLGNGPREPVLRINGETGNVWRQHHVNTGDLVSVTMDAPSGGPALADFALYLTLGEPGIVDVETQPWGLGTSCFPMPLWPAMSGGPFPAAVVPVANTLGHPVLGAAALPTVPQAPTMVLQAPLPPGVYTLQGIIIDSGTAGTAASVTNAIVLTVL